MKRRLSNIRIAIVLVFFAVAFLAIQMSQAVRETPIKQPLSGFPSEIGDWKFARKSFFSAPVIDMLGVNDYISYDYAEAKGRVLNLYISYFTAVGVTGAYHSPQNCLPGGGWNIVAVDDVPLTKAPVPYEGKTIKLCNIFAADELGGQVKLSLLRRTASYSLVIRIHQAIHFDIPVFRRLPWKKFFLF